MPKGWKNKTNNDLKLMEPSYQIDEFIATIATKASKWNRKKTFFGFLGAIGEAVWAIAQDTAVIREISGQKFVDYSRLSYFLDSHEVRISIKWMGQSMFEHGWATSQEGGRKQAERALNYLYDLGVWGDRESVRAHKVKTEDGPLTGNTPCLHGGYNMVLLLLAYETIEKAFVERYGMDALPNHRGALVKQLYDAVFKGYRQYNRMQETETGRIEETPIEERATEQVEELEDEKAGGVVGWMRFIGEKVVNKAIALVTRLSWMNEKYRVNYAFMRPQPGRPSKLLFLSELDPAIAKDFLPA